MTYPPRLLPVALAFLLAACVMPPATKPPAPAAIKANTFPTISPPVPQASLSQVSPAESGTTVWDKLRGSFAMSDCDADPQIVAWAHRYTKYPQRFQQEMRDALPHVTYMQQATEKYAVASEFALLPWVESRYSSMPGHRNLPAGMWQIVQSTARGMGLRINHAYDGRLDTPAATDGVMRMLHDYYTQLHDWRLVDYVFNRGESGVQRWVQEHGLPPDEPAIPKWSVPKITREHLTQLLAISCVVREPSRFNVKLPTLPADQYLETVPIDHGMTLSLAAHHAGMDTKALKRLNPALQNDFLNTGAPAYLFMPHRNAELLRHAMQTASAQGMVASASNTTSLPAIYADKPNPSVPAGTPHVRTHVVKSGESLWQIAHNHATSVHTLERLNHLHGKVLKPGQVLKLDSSNPS